MLRALPLDPARAHARTRVRTSIACAFEGGGGRPIYLDLSAFKKNNNKKNPYLEYY